MARTVSTRHTYAVAPKRLWEIVTDLDALKTVMSGLATFDPLPSGQISKGQVIETNVSLFGILPSFPYRLEIIDCDTTQLHVQSLESGGGIKRWEHTIDIEPTGTACVLKDAITVEAGWRTALVAIWAQYMLKRRHKPRLKLLGIA